MSRREAAIVVTTIFPPDFLAGYVNNLKSFDGVETTQLIVIPDRKTPDSTAAACKKAKRNGLRVTCPTLEEQCDFLSRLAVPDAWVPFNTDNRRNIGFLMALESGCDLVISIDDDNFCPADVDFVARHAMVGTSQELEIRSSQTRWLNICEELTFDTPTTPYPRGFPFAQRNCQAAVVAETKRVPIAINAGLWLDDPDVDAVVRLANQPKATQYHGRPFALDSDTWSPINTQNTAVSRAAMAAYYYVRMGFPIEGLTIDRYGDILSGYFVQKCARAQGEYLRIGDPVCDHHRTTHNLFKDLYHELAGMVLVEELLPWLMELKLPSTGYQDAYAHLADELEAASGRFTGFVFDQGGREFLVQTATNMRVWSSAIECING